MLTSVQRRQEYLANFIGPTQAYAPHSGYNGCVPLIDDKPSKRERERKRIVAIKWAKLPPVSALHKPRGNDKKRMVINALA